LQFGIEEKEVLYGGGARALGMNRRGYRLPLYNKAHYGYSDRSEQLNFSMPIVLSSKCYAIHFDNAPIGFLDLDSKKDNTIAYETISGRMTYQVIASSDWINLVAHYTELTGRQPLLPRWALGNFASRFGYHTEKETRSTVEKFWKDEIPLEAVILDIYWFGADIKGHMGNLSFLEDSFPNPSQMMADFKKKGVKTILITEPFVLSTSKRWQEAVDKGVLATDSAGNPFRCDFYFGNTGIIDVYSDKGKSWFWNIYKDYINMGVGGWWGDLGEPEVHPSAARHAAGTADQVHNIYGHDWAKLIHEGYQKDFPKERPFILMRAGYSGSQRYGLIPWSGDVDRSWGGLKPQPEISLQMGMQGIGFMHSDLGGFAGGAGDTINNELYTRWLQYGVFQPIFRPHAQEHIPAEPVFQKPETKALAKKAIELRYRLLPYNYNLAHQNNIKGTPLMRPIFFEDQSRPELYAYSDAYLWGDAFLISPVTKAGAKSQEVYFPKHGNWFDFYTGEKYKGGKQKTVPVYADRIPTFVRSGAFVPMAKLVQNTAQYSTKQLELHYYHDDKVGGSVGSMYDDDGQTPDAIKKGEYERLAFMCLQDKASLNFTLRTEAGNTTYAIPSREMELFVHGLSAKPSSASIDGKPADVSWNGKVAILRFAWSGQPAKITLAK
jgi:alpha-glucosidase (family GH31 glycosyl hydrolase)